MTPLNTSRTSSISSAWELTCRNSAPLISRIICINCCITLHRTCKLDIGFGNSQNLCTTSWTNWNFKLTLDCAADSFRNIWWPKRGHSSIILLTPCHVATFSELISVIVLKRALFLDFSFVFCFVYDCDKNSVLTELKQVLERRFNVTLKIGFRNSQ